MQNSKLRLAAATFAIVLAAAACGSSSDDSTATGSTATDDVSEPAADADPADDARGEDPDSADPAVEEPAASGLQAGDGWDLVTVGEGIKPSLAIDAEGSPAIAYLTETQAGGVFYANSGDDWAIATVADGYFYGPIDLAFSPDGAANIVYHDHQAPNFRPDAGDLTLAVQAGEDWTLSASDDDGHDGWDSTLRFGPNGELWAAGIEPVDFGTTEGVEFYEYDGSQWSVESIGGPAITYEFNVSVATSADGEPVLSYYDDNADQLHVATRVDGAWIDETVTEPEGGGMFSSIVIGADGTRHVTYYASSGQSSGTVRYAVDDGSGWVIEDVGILDDVVLGMTGARRITSLQLEAGETPVVALTDRSAVWVATRGVDGWETTEVLTAGANPLGQQVQIVVEDTAWHLTTFEATNASPLEGDILYLSLTN